MFVVVVGTEGCSRRRCRFFFFCCFFCCSCCSCCICCSAFLKIEPARSPPLSELNTIASRATTSAAPVDPLFLFCMLLCVFQFHVVIKEKESSYARIMGGRGGGAFGTCCENSERYCGLIFRLFGNRPPHTGRRCGYTGGKRLRSLPREDTGFRRPKFSRQRQDRTGIHRMSQRHNAPPLSRVQCLTTANILKKKTFRR